MIKKKFFMPPFKPEGEWAKEVLELLYNLTNGDPNGKSLYMGDPDNPKDGDILIEEGSAKKLSSGVWGAVSASDLVDSIFPDSAVDGRYYFAINGDTDKLALYEIVGATPVHRTDFGSLITNYFGYSEPMGGLQVLHKDGWRYHTVRTSPTGEGRSAVLGNYASSTYVASSGVFQHVTENQNWYELLVNDDVTEITSTYFAVTYTPVRDEMLYGGTAYAGAVVGEQNYICRMWMTNQDGDILHQIIESGEFDATDDETKLVSLEAEYVTIPDGGGAFWLPNSHPIPVGVPHGPITMHWEFKEPVTLHGVDNTNIRYTVGSEGLTLENVATQEWVTSNVSGAYEHPATHPASMIEQTVDYRFVSDTQIASWDGKIDSTEKASANGVATLDGDSKIPSSQLPDSIAGGLTYTGVWDATNNVPDLTTVGANGIYYKVNVAGTHDLNGINSWAVGDWVLSNGTTWDKIDNTDDIVSVNSKQGVVVLDKTDIGLDQVDNTSDANKPVSTATQSVLDSKINTIDIVDDIITADATKPLSANQGVVLKAAIDAIVGEENVQADWNETDTLSDAYILNKPDLSGSVPQDLYAFNLVDGDLILYYGETEYDIENYATSIIVPSSAVAFIENGRLKITL